MRAGRWWCVPMTVLFAVSACTDGPDRRSIPTTATSTSSAAGSPLRLAPLPVGVPMRQQPEGVTLSDPAFEPLPGARTDFGRLGGAAYQIEVPDDWTGQLVLWMHGFEEFAPEARVTPPDFRRYLIGRGIAWGASSFSSTSLIPGRAADETAALWDYFVREHGRPTWTYAAGLSQGGWAAQIAAERYGNRFDGALGLCGAAGSPAGLSISTDLFVAGAFVAGVTQVELDAAPSVVDLIDQRIRPALADPEAHAQFERILVELTGGPRAFAREGIHLEEETNWRRAGLLVAARLSPPRDDPYHLGPAAGISSEEFNRRAVRLPTDATAFDTFVEGMALTGRLRMPLVTVHTTGDGQVPINQAQILRRQVDAAGGADLLVQRVIEDPGHCGFSTDEQEAALDALVGWVEDDRIPPGTNLDVDALASLDRTFELGPRPGTPAAEDLPGADQRVVMAGRARRDGAAFDARWVGAVVRHQGLVTPCQFELQPVIAGRFEITVLGEEESAGCGTSGAEILLWTYLGEEKLWTREAIPWPSDGTAEVDVDFATPTTPAASPVASEFSGEVYRSDGGRVEPGARVEAYVGDTRCGVASPDVQAASSGTS